MTKFFAAGPGRDSAGDFKIVLQVEGGVAVLNPPAARLLGRQLIEWAEHQDMRQAEEVAAAVPAEGTPIGEFLKSMGGDDASLAKFVESLNAAPVPVRERGDVGFGESPLLKPAKKLQRAYRYQRRRRRHHKRSK